MNLGLKCLSFGVSLLLLTISGSPVTSLPVYIRLMLVFLQRLSFCPKPRKFSFIPRTLASICWVPVRFRHTEVQRPWHLVKLTHLLEQRLESNPGVLLTLYCIQGSSGALVEMQPGILQVCGGASTSHQCTGSCHADLSAENTATSLFFPIQSVEWNSKWLNFSCSLWIFLPS
jgi:hypothetical protein